MKTKPARWWQGFLQAEQHYKDKAFVEDVKSGRLNFINPNGGSVEYIGYQEASYQFERGMKDYIQQYEEVVKDVLR